MAAWWKFWSKHTKAVDLIYRWRHPRALSFRLVFFVLISAAMHLAGFYVFEVVYPPNKKILPRDAGVWMLPDNDPQVQALLARHGGSLGVFRAVAADDDAAGTRQAVPFRLSYDNYLPGFAGLPPRSLGGPLAYPDAVPADLPPVEDPIGLAGTGPIPPPDLAASLIWRAAGGEEQVVPWTGGWPDGHALGEAGAQWEFRVAYNHHGRVIEALVAKGIDPAADALLRRQVLGLMVPESIPRPAASAPAWLTVLVSFPHARHD